MVADTPDPRFDLEKIPWLKTLDPPGWDVLLADTRLHQYSSSEVVFLEGDTATRLFVVRQGWVKAVKLSADGREQILDFVGAGRPVNFAPIFAEQPNPATLIALEDCQLWSISQQTLLNLLDRYPAMSRLIIKSLAGRLMYAVTLVEDLSLRSVTARLAKLLLIQIQHTDQPVIIRRRWATQAEIAARLGTVPDVINRALRSLADDGLIEVSRRQIAILDKDGLQTRIESV